MPTYQYECSNCGFELEKFQSISEKRMKKCPECGKNKLERLIGTGSGIIFKGNGFYETDYKKKSSKEENKAKADAPACKSCKNADVCAAGND